MSNDRSQPTTLVFGDYFDLSEQRQAETAGYLEAAWLAQFRRPLSTLSADLDALREYYKPKLTAQALRKLVEEIAEIGRQRPPLDATLCIALDDRRALVTPEGRALLEVVRRGAAASVSPSGSAPSPEVLVGVWAALIDFYSEPQRGWFKQALTGGDLRPATLGYVVFLLLNDCIGEQRALRLPKKPEDDARLAGAVIPVVNAFASGIGGAPLTGRELNRMRSNWAVARAASQLPGIVRNEAGPTDGRLSFIHSGSERSAIDRVAQTLVNRRGFNIDVLEAALGATCEELDRSRPLLLSWNMSWESPAHTRHVRESLLDAARIHGSTR